MFKANIVVAGRRTIGLPLINKLKLLGHQVLCSFTRRDLWNELEEGGSTRIRSIDLSEPTEEKLTEVLDFYCKRGVDDKEPKADVAFIAIPSGGRGEVEMEYIEYFRSRGLYVILFPKGAFAYHYDKLVPHLNYIGRRAIAGARVSILSWLRMHHLYGKRITLYGIINASGNKFFTECGKNGSIWESFRTVQAAGLAEPGAKDPVSFINGEFGDMILKMCAVHNDGIALRSGPFVTPNHLGEPVQFTPENLREVTSPSVRFRPMVRITNTLGQKPFFDPEYPGSLCTMFNSYELSTGLYDVSRRDAIAEWASIHDGERNAILVQDDDGKEGPLETGGIGAGPSPTIGAALCDLAEYLQNREQMFRSEVKEPVSKQKSPVRLGEVDESVA